MCETADGAAGEGNRTGVPSFSLVWRQSGKRYADCHGGLCPRGQSAGSSPRALRETEERYDAVSYFGGDGPRNPCEERSAWERI